MEVGRTSRSVIMVIGEVAEADGSRHKVRLHVGSSRTNSSRGSPSIRASSASKSISASPGKHAGQSARTGLVHRSGRGQGVKVPVRVELVVPAHIRGVAADSITLAADQATGTLTIKFSADNPGPFNMLRCSSAPNAMKGENDPVVAEAKIEVVVGK